MLILRVILLLLIAPSAFPANNLCDFKILINKEKNDLKIFSVFVMPGSNINLKVLSKKKIMVRFENKVQSPQKGSYSFTAPRKKGNYELLIRSDESCSMLVNIFVKVSLSHMKKGYLNRYRIGNYPKKPLNNNPVYAKPKGLLEVTQENLNLKLSPNLVVSDFVCKQEGGFPKYILVNERLLLKLEYILDMLLNKNIKISKFKFISGYRTPYYNKLIGNVPYSRHIYGGAADIFIDEDNDGRMDDINGDNKFDQKDADHLYSLIDKQHRHEEYKEYLGGLGIYKRTQAHPSFIHIDARGYKSRW
jgi:hypothetical protein